MTEKDIKQFYNSKRWKIKRNDILKRDHYECQDCLKRIKDAAINGVQLAAVERKIRCAQEVHHIKELREHPELALDDNNLISLCIECHNIRHGRYPKKIIRRKPRLTEEKW